jgi:hypothetical protein
LVKKAGCIATRVILVVILGQTFGKNKYAVVVGCREKIGSGSYSRPVIRQWLIFFLGLEPSYEKSFMAITRVILVKS